MTDVLGSLVARITTIENELEREKIIEQGAGGGGAPTNASYVVLGLNASLSAERVLTGTLNQITVTDGGANNPVTLSLPQNIHTAAAPTFAGMTFTGLAGGATNTVLVLSAGNVVQTRTIDARVWGSSLVDGSGAATRVAYWTDADTLTSDANFTWNGTTLTVTDSHATTTPAVVLTQGSTGDSALRFALTGAVSFAVGIDNSDSDKFKISYDASGTAVLGTNDQLEIDGANSLLAVGRGVVANRRVSLAYSNASPAVDKYTLYAEITVSGTGGTSTNVGIASVANATQTAGTVTGVFGVFGNAFASGSGGTVTSVMGLRFDARNAGANTATTLAGIVVDFGYTSSGGGTDAYGLLLTPYKTSTGAPTNAYGIYVNSVSIGGTLNFAVYTNLGIVHFGDNVGLIVTAFGTNAKGVIGLANVAGGAVVPTSAPADMVQIYGKDSAAAKAWPWFLAEDGVERAVLGAETTVAISTGTGTVKMGGATSRNSIGWLKTHDHTGNIIYIPYWTTITG